MKQGIIETIVGLFVIAIAVWFFMFAYNKSSTSKDIDGYDVLASFQNINGLAEGSDVKLSGIKVGYVKSLDLENDTYLVVTKLRIKKSVNIPTDSRVIISTNGLIGGKYVRIDPGANEDNIENGGKIKFTQSALNIEDLIAKLMYSLTSK